ncbi:hypothetical protein PVAG01_06159 [Phlyctema vagabunda]|uniref:Uncharacterized protein n=1 Tax=Phlyctema vagabunda TaxID=108571 RepID=A0ABR4PFE3_9HELO
MAPITLLRLNTIRRLRPNPQRIINSSIAIRPISSTSSLQFPRKASQDRESMNTDADEYSKSGTDSTAAEQKDAAFDPDITDPNAEKNKAGQGGGAGNPLDVSPANPDVSKQGGKEAEGGVEKGQGQKQSGGGSPPKGGKR